MTGSGYRERDWSKRVVSLVSTECAGGHEEPSVVVESVRRNPVDGKTGQAPPVKGEVRERRRGEVGPDVV